jgi:uncharacterized protein
LRYKTFREQLYFYRDKDKMEIDLLIFLNNTIYPVEIKKTASPKSDDAKNFFVTGRIKNVTVSFPCIICNCEKPVLVSKDIFVYPCLLSRFIYTMLLNCGKM